MKDETLFALAGAIRKWVDIARGKGEDYGTSNCPLCHLYRGPPFPFLHENACKGCPIVEADSAHVQCRGTPYEEWIEHQATVHAWTNHPFKVRCPKCEEIAWREALFLCALIPEEATIPSSLDRAIEEKLHIRYGRATVQGGLSWWFPDKEQPDPENHVVIRDGDCGEVRPTNIVSRAEWDDRVEKYGLWKKVGLWSFVPADDPAAATIRFCHQHPESAGAELYRLRNRKCGSCRHWVRAVDNGYCYRLPKSDSPIKAWTCDSEAVHAGQFMTTEDFGCELWEARE